MPSSGVNVQDVAPSVIGISCRVSVRPFFPAVIQKAFTTRGSLPPARVQDACTTCPMLTWICSGGVVDDMAALSGVAILKKDLTLRVFKAGAWGSRLIVAVMGGGGAGGSLIEKDAEFASTLRCLKSCAWMRRYPLLPNAGVKVAEKTPVVPT